MFLVTALGWFVMLRPAFLGGPGGYVIVYGASMQPALSAGDLALLRKQDTYQIGDVVSFGVGGGQVIHRIIGGDASEGYRLQGDNRDRPDHWRPTPDDISGRMWLRVPNGGHVILWLRQPLHLALAAGLCGFMAVLAGEEKTPSRTIRRPKPS